MNIQPKADADFVVGVDLGGQNVRAAVIGKDEKIAGQAKNASLAEVGVEQVVGAIAQTVRQAVERAGRKMSDIGAVGMAVPGHIDTKAGITRWSPNFFREVDGSRQIYLDVPFTGPVADAIGIATYMGNDANIAALGEFRYGAGRHVEDMVMITLGTGIGGGVIVGGRLVTGSTGGAVELGHHVIVAGGRQCGCGTLGCFEAYCGTAAIVERALRAMESGHDTLLLEGFSGDKTTLRPVNIDQAARKGDKLALGVFEETGYYLGIGIGNTINLFNPAVIVIGGGIREATGLLAAAERSAKMHSVASLAKGCKIVAADLGDDAGVMGAAELAWRKVNGQD